MGKYLEDFELNTVLEDYFEYNQEEIYNENYQQFNLTVEEINDIFISNDVIIDEAFNLKMVQDYLNDNFNPFLKLGISPSNIKLIKTECINTGSNIINIVKTQGINNNSKLKISEELNNFYDLILDILKEFEDWNIGVPLPSKLNYQNISKSIFLLLGVVSINIIFTVLFIALFNHNGIRLGAVIVAPLTEEAGKIISIKGKFDKEYFFIFNLYEFTSYVKNGLKIGVELKKMLFIRSVGILLHFTLTLIHKFMQSNIVKKLIKPKDEKDFENKCILIGNILAVALHSFFNSSKFEDVFWNKIGFLN